MSFKSLTFKLLVLVIVLLIWSVHSILKEHHTEIELPIVITNLDNGMIVTEPTPNSLVFYAKGKGIDIYNMLRKDNYIVIDASNFQIGPNEYPVTDQHIDFGDPLYRTLIDYTLNKNVIFYFDRIAVKQVRIVKRFLTLEDELYLTQRNASITPSHVEIEGPQESLDKITGITTIPLTKSIADSPSGEVELEIPDEVLGIRPDAVKIVLETPLIINRTIPLLRIHYPEEDNIIIIPQFVTVKIEGVAGRIHDFRPSMIRAYIDDPMRYENDFAPIRFQVPEDIILLEYTPRRVQVIVN